MKTGNSKYIYIYIQTGNPKYIYIYVQKEEVPIYKSASIYIYLFSICKSASLYIYLFSIYKSASKYIYLFSIYICSYIRVCLYIFVHIHEVPTNICTYIRVRT
jgi:hypothetical protein